MPSHDERWCVERYPDYEDGKLKGFSYGCPDLDLMGYSTIGELFTDMITKLIDAEVVTRMEEEE